MTIDRSCLSQFPRELRRPCREVPQSSHRHFGMQGSLQPSNRLSQVPFLETSFPGLICQSPAQITGLLASNWCYLEPPNQERRHISLQGKPADMCGRTLIAAHSSAWAQGISVCSVASSDASSSQSSKQGCQSSSVTPLGPCLPCGVPPSGGFSLRTGSVGSLQATQAEALARMALPERPAELLHEHSFDPCALSVFFSSDSSIER